MWLTVFILFLGLYQFFIAGFIQKEMEWRIFSFAMGFLCMVQLAFSPVL